MIGIKETAFIAGFFALAGALLAGAAQEWRHDARYTNLQLRYETSQRESEQRHRAREHELIDSISRLEKDAQNEIKELNDIIDGGRAVSNGLQDQLSDISRRYREASAVASECKAAGVAAGMLAELLGESERLAQKYAEQADRARIAGKLCESAYDKVSSNKL